MAGCLVSFGGYNGKYHNSVHVYRPEGYVLVKAASAEARGAERGALPAGEGAWLLGCAMCPWGCLVTPVGMA